MVVIDGPASVVTSLTGRDESHIQFLDCDPRDKRDAKSVYTARYICMNDSPHSNCDAVHEGGAKGTIVKLPEGCGFATYGVVNDIRSSTNLTVEHELRKRAPSPNPLVYEMDISYNYSLVKRDSGTVYVRIDYGDTVGYWNDIVKGDAITKRGVNETFDKRFWSPNAAVWKEQFDDIRQLGLPADYTLNLEQDNIYQLLYSQDESANCGGKDGFMSIELEGTVQSKIRWGVTMVGTISPEISFEEAYGFFDADMTLIGTIMLDGKASVNVVGSTKPASVFATDISNFGYSEPGIVSFTPKMNINASLTGSGTVNSDFRLGFMAGTNGYVRTNAPLSLGALSGDVGNLAGPEAWDGFAGGSPVSTGEASSKRSSGSVTLLGLNLGMRTWLEVDLYAMGTDVESADAQFIVDIPHYIRIVSDSGNQISVVGGDQQVGIEAYSAGISTVWEQDDSSHLVGSVGIPYVFTSGASNDAPDRLTPGWGTDGVIQGDYFGCSANSSTQLVCYQSSNMSIFDPDWLIDPEDGVPTSSERRRRRKLGDFTPPLPTREQLLEPRGTGNRRNFTIITPSGTRFIIRSHTYPNGLNGAFLVGVNPNAGYYWLADPENCEDISVTANGNPLSASWVTEHIVELGTFSLLLGWFMYTRFVLPDGTVRTSDFTAIPETLLNLQGFLWAPWNTWDPTNPSTTTPGDDIWTAFGDTTNPGVLANCETVFNGVKMQIWQGNNPMADTTWNGNDYDDTSEATGYFAAQVREAFRSEIHIDS